jgi:sugar phosphate permease
MHFRTYLRIYFELIFTAFSSLIVLLSDMAPPSARGGAIGLYRSFQDIGGFVGPLFFMIVYVSVSSHAAFLGAAAINVANVFVLYLARGRLSMPRADIQ